MSNPVLFFIFIIVIDLILKSVKNKKKIEENRGEQERAPQQKNAPIRDIMSTLRDEVERERQKELERRQGKTKQEEQVKTLIDEHVVSKKTYEDDEYWNNKRRIEEDKRLQERVRLERNDDRRDIREDVIRGIIFSEILSEPKSIKNQRKSV